MTVRGATLSRVIQTAADRGRSLATDQDLLRRFAEAGDQGAFEAVVRRHAGLVLSVCRRALANAQDAEDACQATFLILAKKARAGRWQPSIANWLFATARRVARDLRRAAGRRARREGRAAVPESVVPVDQMTGRELLAVIDEELDRLPPIYREPLLLYYQAELARDEIAARLGVPTGTVKIRLERGRKRLGAALTRRGVTLSIGLLTLMATSPAGASPPRLVEAIRATVAGKAPPAVAALAEGAAVNGFMKKAVLGAVALAAAAVVGLGLGEPRTTEAGPPTDRPTPARPATGAAQESPPSDEVSCAGRVIDVDGKPVAAARVRVVPWAGRAGTFGPTPAPTPTDAEGRYDVRVPRAALTDAQSGDEAPPMVLAAADGFFAGWTTAQTDGRIELARADSKAAGRVTDLEGRPVAGATVRVTAVAAPAGRSLDPWLEALRRDPGAPVAGRKLGPIVDAGRLAGPVVSAKTGADGRFELSGYAADRVLRATIEGPGIATFSVGLVTRDVGPGGLPGSSGLVYFGVGGAIPAKPSRPITGVVRDRDTGKAVAGATVRSLVMAGRSQFDTGLVTASTGKDGAFTLAGMPKGAGNRLLVSPGRGQPYLVRSVEVPDPSGIDPVAIEIALARGVPIEGVVHDPAGRPIPNVSVVYLANRFNDRALDPAFGGQSGPSAPTDADGRFRVVGLPGPGYLVANGPGRSYLAATERAGDGAAEEVRLDTVESPARADWFHAVYALDVPRSATAFRQDVVLDRGVNVAVTVVDRDGTAVAGCRSLSRRAGEDWQDETRPGEHRVEAVNPKRPRGILFRHAERDLVGVLSLPPDFAGRSHRLTLRPGVTLTGRVLSDDGRPRAGVAVSILVRPGKDDPGDAQRFRHLDEKIVTDAGGQFRVPALVPGFTYEVSINGQFVANSTFELDAKATGTKHLGDLRLRLTGD